MLPAHNKKRCAAVPFETGIHFRRNTDFFPEEDTTKSYSGFKPEPTRLQAEGDETHGCKIPVVLSQKSLGWQSSQHQDHPRLSDRRNCSTYEVGESQLVPSQGNREGGIRPPNLSPLTFSDNMWPSVIMMTDNTAMNHET
ncbi:poly polymerase [Trichonephila clavipes]|nr:poly polymerase [Trichonephila clavipes]